MSYKQTEIYIVDKVGDDEEKAERLAIAGMWIKKGEVVAFPTETVYGLGANALDETAVKKIFKAKGRPSDNPLIVHIAEERQLDDLVREVSPFARKLISAFWPGPLTIIFKKKDAVANSVTAGLDTVAVRMPDHPVARDLLKSAGVPVAAPSANLSGKPSPTSANHVYHDLNGRIKGIVDGGQTGVGLESTVIDCSKDEPVLYRPGGVTKEQIEAIVGPIQVPTEKEITDTPLSPGMKYTHYSPTGAMYLVLDKEKINHYIEREQELGKKVGVLTTTENADCYKADVTVTCGTRSHLESVATALYESLRTFDKEDVDVIFSETFPKVGLGVAIMNRLEKAADGQIE